MIASAIALSALLSVGSIPIDGATGTVPAVRGTAYTVRDATPEPSPEWVARQAEEAIRYRHRIADVDRWYWSFRDAGWTQASMRWVLLMVECESMGDPYAVGRYERERGVLQVHPVHKGWLGDYGLSWDGMFDPAQNARAALVIFADQGADDAWTCHARQGRPEPGITQREARMIVASWA
jgi:hypothetical protein